MRLTAPVLQCIGETCTSLAAVAARICAKCTGLDLRVGEGKQQIRPVSPAPESTSSRLILRNQVVHRYEFGNVLSDSATVVPFSGILTNSSEKTYGASPVD